VTLTERGEPVTIAMCAHCKEASRPHEKVRYRLLHRQCELCGRWCTEVLVIVKTPGK
jgi:hypothetical protein